MTRTFKITHPRARLEARLLVASSFSSGFALIHYEHSRANARWWQRTITATDDQWLHLSGRDGTSPDATWSKILDHRERPSLPLSMLVLGDFVAYAANQAQPEAGWLFQWVAWALDDLLRFSPPSPSTRGGLIVEPERLEATTHALIDAVLDGNISIPWLGTDGAQLQTLIRLGELIWSFPPNLVRRLVNTFVAHNDDSELVSDNEDGYDLDTEHDNELVFDDEDGYDPDTEIIHRPHIGAAQLVQLSGIHWWRTGAPNVRQLPFRMSTLAFPALIQYALILTHPDAPRIEDADLARLCDGAIGQASDRPSPVQSAYNDAVKLPEFVPTAARARIAAYAEVAATEAISLPVGQWDIPASSRFPLFRAFDLRAVRVIARPDGCWVRLLPPRDTWGKVLWWVPQLEPPACLAFALGTGRAHPLVWAVHETMWMLWRDMRISGVPDA